MLDSNFSKYEAKNKSYGQLDYKLFTFYCYFKILFVKIEENILDS